MRIAKRLILSLFLAIPTLALANTTPSILALVTIGTLGFDQNAPGIVWIKTSTLPLQQARISCHVNNDWNYVLSNSDTDPARAALKDATFSALMAAHLANQKVILVGTGECSSDAPQMEDLKAMYTERTR